MSENQLDLTIRSTNGATWNHHFNANEKVGTVLDLSEKHFISEGALQEGDYGLALVVNGTAQPPIDNGFKLDAAGVTNGAILVLVPLEPQTDGS